MKLLTSEDLDLLKSTLLASKDRVIDRDLVARAATLTRLEATRDYLSRVEFATPEEIASARTTYCWDEGSGIQINDDARVSREVDGGTDYIWIGAWVMIGGKGPEE